jgi:hypothetical protein
MTTIYKHLNTFLYHRPDYKDLKMYDILNSSKKYDYKKIQNFINFEFENSDHRLKNNYLNLLDTLSNYSAFNILEINDEIIGFSGLETKKFPSSYGRVITRTYLSYKYRSKGVSHRKFPDLASGLMLPYQAELAQSLNINHVFFSIDRLNKKKYANILANKISKFTNNNWVLLDGFYNTCVLINEKKINNDISCWQNIVYLDNGSQFNLPSISTDRYIELESLNSYTQSRRS